MPRARFEKLAVEKREQILSAALTEFAANGFEGASYNRIIGRAGVSKGAMYYYFEDKMDLYATVLVKVTSEMSAPWAEVFEGDGLSEGFWGVIETMIHHQMKLAQENPEWLAMGRTLYALDPALLHGGPLEHLHELGRGWMERLMERGRALGEVRGDVPMELLVAALYAMGEVFDRWFVGHWDEVMGEESARDKDEMVHTMVDMMRRVASPPAGRSEEEGS